MSHSKNTYCKWKSRAKGGAQFSQRSRQFTMSAGEDDLVCFKWPSFLSSLQAQLVKHKQDTFPGLSALKLLVTNLTDLSCARDT